MDTIEQDWIDLPDIPAAEDLRFRTYVGTDDIPGMARVIRAANAANGETEYVSDDYLRSQVLNHTHFPAQEARLLAVVDGDIVACSEFEYADTTAGRRDYTSHGYVDPEWRRRGIGAAMAAWNDARLLEIAGEQRHPGGAALTTWIEEADTGATVLAERRGYSQTRVGFYMVRPNMVDIESPPMPEGLEVRPVSREYLPRIWEAKIEAFRDHHGSHDGSPAAYRRWSEDPVLDLDLLLIAFDGYQVAGCVQGWIDP